MLPTASAESPATRSRCATSAVVVVLPFVPVIATVRVLPPPPLPARARNPRSTSEKIGTPPARAAADRKSTRLNSSHSQISYAVFCLKKKKRNTKTNTNTPCSRHQHRTQKRASYSEHVHC